MLCKAPVMIVAALVTFTALISSDDVAARANVDSWNSELPIRQPWLRDQLPDDALIYLRIPNLPGLFSMAKGNDMDPALRSTANIENVIKLRQGVVDNVLPQIPAFADLRLRMLQEHVSSPVEIAFFFAPAPSVPVAASLDVHSNRDFEDVIEAVGMDMPGFGLAGPLDADGIGQVTGAPVPMLLRFDALNAHSVGKPDGVLLFSIPTPDEFSRLELPS